MQIGVIAYQICNPEAHVTPPPINKFEGLHHAYFSVLDMFGGLDALVFHATVSNHVNVRLQTFTTSTMQKESILSLHTCKVEKFVCGRLY